MSSVPNFLHKGSTARAIFLLAAALVALSAKDVSAATPPRRYRLCGEFIPRMLSFVCGSRGYHYHFKRTSYAPPFAATGGDGGRYFVYPTARRLRTRGISDECCTTPCTLSNLESYCARDAADGGDATRLTHEEISGIFQEAITSTQQSPLLQPEFQQVLADDADAEKPTSQPPPHHATTPPSGAGHGGNAQHYFFDYHTYPPDSRWNIIIRKGHLRR